MTFYGSKRHYFGLWILEKGIEVDKAKIEVIDRLSPLSLIQVVRSFLGHAILSLVY